MRYRSSWMRPALSALALISGLLTVSLAVTVAAPSRAHAQESEAQGERHGPDPVTVDNWSLGGGLLAAGLVVLAPGIVTAAQHGECTGTPSILLEDGTLGCSEIYHVEEALPWLIGGGALALAGALVLILQPFEVRLRADSRSASLTVRGRF